MFVMSALTLDSSHSILTNVPRVFSIADSLDDTVMNRVMYGRVRLLVLATILVHMLGHLHINNGLLSIVDLCLVHMQCTS